MYIYIYTFNELTDFKDIYQVLTITSNEALTKQISKDYLKPPLTGALYVQYMYWSGQIIIFHQPRFPWNKGIPLTKPPFGGKIGRVFGRYNLTRLIKQHQETQVFTIPNRRTVSLRPFPSTPKNMQRTAETSWLKTPLQKAAVKQLERKHNDT